MAPLHHHYEMKGWSETKVMVRFWIVTGILAGSLQKVTIDRLLRLVDAAGLEAHIKVRRAA